MKFENATDVEQVVWQMRLADYPRGLNRSRINGLFNGLPPYSEEEVRENNIASNVNFLEGTKIAHDARRQFNNAFCTADPLFTVSLDYGPTFKRREWGQTITQEINKRIRHSLPYLELRRNVFASVVLHGIGPAMWSDEESWCPDALGVEDVLMPSNTLLTLKNLPFFGVYRQYTAMQFRQMTSGKNVDCAWNMPLVAQVQEWLDKQAQMTLGTTWPEVWSPEKMEERIKGDGGLYASDAVPTIGAYDFYFWSDDGKESGWNRRMVLDTWNEPGAGGEGVAGRREGMPGKGAFLYNPGNRKYADKLGEIIHFQFADASCVAPFRYHSVRSLGFLLYAVCHLQNRLRCKFNDAVFESMLQYFRVANPEDKERALKVNLVDKGIIPDGLEFIKGQDRWAVRADLAQMAMGLNRQTMTDNSSSFTQDFDFAGSKSDETATRTMAKVNATAALVGSMLNQAYNYETFRYQEMARRFCVANSKDADVRKFRVQCLRAGVPESALDSERWNISPTRVVGSGDKMLQQAIADKLMAMRAVLEPTAQKRVDRIYISAYSDDYALANDLVPELPAVSDSVHDAQLVTGTLMLGLPMAIKTGINHTEYVEALLANEATLVQGIEAQGGMTDAATVLGLECMAQHIEQHIAIIAQDPAEKARVKQYGDDLGKLMNLVKAYGQRLAEQQQEQAQAGGGDGGEAALTAAKAQASVILAQNKAKIASDSHAQKTAQRQISFEQKAKQDEERHAAQLRQQADAHALELQKARDEHMAELRKAHLEMLANVEAARVKAETRRPKAERRPKSERKSKSEG